MSSTSSKFWILVADDHALVRGGLAQLVKLVENNVEVVETNDYKQTLEHLSQDQVVDLLLLDLLMPGMNGVEGISNICKKWPEIPVIVVSAKEDIGTIRSALAAGAMGYIPKTSSPEVMMSAIKLVISGGVYIPPHVLGAGTLSEDRLQEQNIAVSPEENFKAGYDLLTERQLEVLDLMAFGKSNKEIANDLGLTTGTVKMHSSRIFKTLNVQNRTEAVMKYTQLKKENETV